MILTSIGPDAPFHRPFTPRWAHAPQSSAGAALAGGGFSRPGVETRYLAATTETALAEYQGESPLLPPATLVTFLVTAQNVVDFTGGYDPAHWTPIWAEAQCNWKGMAFLEGVEPPSWVIGDIVRDAIRHVDGRYFLIAREGLRRAAFHDTMRKQLVDNAIAPGLDRRRPEQEVFGARQIRSRIGARHARPRLAPNMLSKSSPVVSITACVREATLSLRRISETCAFTVVSPTSSSKAICLLSNP